MFSYFFYKTLHIAGAFFVIGSLGGLCLLAIVGHTPTKGQRRLAALTHGFGMLFSLVGGFGVLGMLGIPFPWPIWVFAKILIWACLGGEIALALRQPQWGKALWWLTLALGTLATYFAIYKPFEVAGHLKFY